MTAQPDTPTRKRRARGKLRRRITPSGVKQRQCTNPACREWFEESAYYFPANSAAPGGLGYECRRCYNAYQREYQRERNHRLNPDMQRYKVH